MKIKLIAPARKPEWRGSFWDLKTLCELAGCKAAGAPLVLPTLAALTPSDVEVILTDENAEPVNFEEKVDLVGITGITSVIPRAYEIADEFRKRGVPVVMGGIHVSMLPEEAIEHCDSVVTGEAEEIWEQVVKDAQKGSLQKFYRTPRFPDLANSPTPRWDLLKNDAYSYFTLQTGRGCPYDCDFCTVKVFNGRRYRHKRVEQVVREISFLQSIDSKKLIFFADDNLLSVPGYAKELFKAIKPLNVKSWWCQSSVNRLKDDRLLDLMYEAGCRVVFVGFESVSQKSLEAMNKDKINRVQEYKEIVDKVHAHKIAVFGSFIVGNDNEDEHIFEDTVKFIEEANVAFSMINILTPLVGSKLYQRLKEEGRILNHNWENYDVGSVCFKPKRLNIEILRKECTLAYQKIYDYAALYKRLSHLWKRKVLVKSKNDLLRLFSRGRMKFSLYSIFNMKEKERRRFILKSLWNLNVPSVTNSILLALAFHDFVYHKS